MESTNGTHTNLSLADSYMRNITIVTPSTCFAALGLCIVIYIVLRLFRPTDTKAIPWAKTSIPYIGRLGHVIEFARDPPSFLLKQRELVGEVFRLDLVLMNITFLVGAHVSDVSHSCIFGASWIVAESSS
jgi:hypothetical protein